MKLLFLVILFILILNDVSTYLNPSFDVEETIEGEEEAEENWAEDESDYELTQEELERQEIEREFRIELVKIAQNRRKMTLIYICLALYGDRHVLNQMANIIREIINKENE